MLKIANPKDVVIKTRPGVTTMDFKRGTTITAGPPSADVKRARDAARKALEPLNKLNMDLPKPSNESSLGATIKVRPKVRAQPKFVPSGSNDTLTATYKSNPNMKSRK